MNTRQLRSIRFYVLALVCVLGISATAMAAAPSRVAEQDTVDKIQHEGRARVIIKLRTRETHRSEFGMSRSAIRRQRSDIAAVQRRIKDRLRGSGISVRREFKSVPYLAAEIDAAGLAMLESAGLDVERVYEDRLAEPFLAESIPQIEADLAHQAGLDGTGSVVVIADTGIDATHPFLTGKVIDEACYALSEDGLGGDCPNGQATQTTTGAGLPCTYAPETCRHGSHVAGIAAGVGSTFTGVAPGADLIAIQVFHRSTICGFFEENPCARAYSSDVAAALERVYELRDQYAIASVNLSLGGGGSLGPCDDDLPELRDVINNLRAAGIATVVASGNGSYGNAISWPACISSAISVGAVDENDAVASFSNVSEDLDLFAPGTAIDSSIPGGAFATFSGTSMSAPHVAGAWAVLEQLNPSATVDDNLNLLVTTGRPVTDQRGTTNTTKPRMRLGGAVGIEYPTPTIASVTPTLVRAWGPETSLTVSGADFVRSSVVMVDGAAVPTTYVSATELTATLTKAFLATQAMTFDVSVYSPPPGGGTTTAMTIIVTQPSLTVSTTAAETGAPVTVTLANGPGNGFDWIGLSAVNDPIDSYIEFVYVPSLQTATTWTVDMPDTPGDYHFRLFENDGYVLIASSVTITVTAAPPEPPPPPPPPPPTPVLQVDMTAVNGGDAVTVTLTDGPANSDDWIALAALGDPDTTYLQFSYVAPASTSATWTATMPSVEGDYEFRLFENGGYNRLATSATVTVSTPPVPPPPEPPPDPPPSAATLGLSENAVNAGDAVTVTLADGPGNNFDWIGLAAVGAPYTSYLQFVYVPSGASSTTWTINMPTVDGDYEFRLFENGGYTLLVASAPITVTTAPPPPPPDPPPTPPPPQLDVSATAVIAGDAVTLTLTDGPGNNFDWLSLASVGDTDASYVQFQYVGAGETTAVWTVTMPLTPGDYEFRLFENDGYNRLATSMPITVSTPPPDPPPEPPPEPTPPSLAVSATTVDGGDAVTVSLNDGPGNNFDWLALAGVGDPESTYLEFQYVAAGDTTATWTVTMPATPGDYEIRLFENDTYTRLATSATITVSPPPPEPPPPPAPPPPSLTVDATTVTGGATVTVTLSDGLGNSFDWLALAGVGDPDTTYLQWTYVGFEVTSTSWTVTLPATPGSYEFRLFENSGYNRLATSPTVVVTP